MSNIFENKGAFGATIVVAASDSLKNRSANYVCDGVDDQVEIQAAIDALPAGGGKVVLLDGAYLISAAIALNSDNLDFGGVGTSTILKIADSGVAQDWNVLTIGNVQNVKIHDLQVDANRTGTVAPSSHIYGAPIGYYHAGAVPFPNANITIMHCYLHSGHGRGIFVYGSTGWKITYNRADDFPNGDGIDIDHGFLGGVNQAETQTDKMLVMGNYVSNCKHGIHVDNSSGGAEHTTGIGTAILIRDNLVTDCSDISIYLNVTYPAQTDVIGNTIVDAGSSAIYAQTPNSLIMGNTILFPVGTGIYAVQSQVIGNRVTGGATRGIYATDSLVKGNKILGAHQCGIALYGNSLAIGNILKGILGETGNARFIEINGAWSRATENQILPITNFSYNPSAALSIGDTFIPIVAPANITLGIEVVINEAATTEITRVKHVSAEGITITDALINNYTVAATVTPNTKAQFGFILANVSGISVVHNYIDNSAITFKAIFDNNPVHSALISRQHSDLFTDVLASSANLIVNAQNFVDGAIALTGVQPKYPRGLVFAITAGVTEYTLIVVGTSGKDQIIAEIFTFAADGLAFSSDNAFDHVTSITLADRAGAAATIDVGIDGRLGLMNVIYETGDIWKITKATVKQAVNPAHVDVDFDTYDMAAAIGIAVNDDFEIWYRSNLNIIA